MVECSTMRNCYVKDTDLYDNEICPPLESCAGWKPQEYNTYGKKGGKCRLKDGDIVNSDAY